MDSAGKKKALSQRDVDRATRLARVWESEKLQRPISQKELALQRGTHHTNVSQYINARIPLNVEAQLWFARYLRRSPADIWPDFEFDDLIAHGEESLALLNEGDRRIVRELIRTLRLRSA